MSIDKIVSKHLASNRRLTIPALGTLIVKCAERSGCGESSLFPEQELLFSEFIKEDDGVLRGLLTNSGMGELEAAGAIDRLIFELRHATTNTNETYTIEGVGEFFKDELGRLCFESTKGATLATPTNEPKSVDALFAKLSEEQSQSKQSETLFSEEDRKESREVTQAGRTLIDWAWIVIPTIVLVIMLTFVGFVLFEQWRAGDLELPASVEKIVYKLLEIVK